MASKKKGFYAKSVPAPAKKTAEKNPVGTVETPGTLRLPTIPKHEAVIHGLGPATRTFGHPSIKGAHGYGHAPHARAGHHRLSGSPDAHRIGGKLSVPKIKT